MNNSGPIAGTRVGGKSVKVLWVTHRSILDPMSGGAEKTARRITQKLSERGHQVWVLSAASHNQPPFLQGTTRVLEWGNPTFPHAALPAVLWKFGPFDFIIDDLAHAVPWGSPWLSRARGVAFFRHLHARTLAGQTNPFAALALKAIEHTYPLIYSRWKFVTESSSSIEDLERLGIERNRIIQIRPGVDGELFTPGEKSREIRMVYFGGMRRYKRPWIAIDLLEILRDRGIDISLDVVGGGPLSIQLAARAKAKGLDNFTRFYGRLDEESLARLLSSEWLNLHSAVAEGWCLSALEACSAGVPTVGFDVPGLRDSVDSGQTGILVREGDLGALANAAERITSAPESWVRPCQAWAANFDWDLAADQWDLLIRNGK